MRDKITRQCPQTTAFEVKGEPKQIRTEVPLLTSLPPYRWAKPAHNESEVHLVEFMALVITAHAAEVSVTLGDLAPASCSVRAGRLAVAS